MKTLIIGVAIAGLVLYGLFQYIVYALTKNEQKYQKNAHKVTWTHEDMLAMAKKLSKNYTSCKLTFYMVDQLIYLI